MKIRSVIYTATVFILVVVSIVFYSCRKNTNPNANDPCVGYTCLNGGTCNSTSGTAECKCPSGFNGVRCEFTCPTKGDYLGTYIGYGTYAGDTSIIYSHKDDKKLFVTIKRSSGYKLDSVSCDVRSCSIGFLSPGATAATDKHMDCHLSVIAKDTLSISYLIGVIGRFEGKRL